MSQISSHLLPIDLFLYVVHALDKLGLLVLVTDRVDAKDVRQIEDTSSRPQQPDCLLVAFEQVLDELVLCLDYDALLLLGVNKESKDLFLLQSPRAVPFEHQIFICKVTTGKVECFLDVSRG